MRVRPRRREERSSAEAISNPPPDESALRIAKRVWETYMDASPQQVIKEHRYCGQQYNTRKIFLSRQLPQQARALEKIDGLTVRPG